MELTFNYCQNCSDCQQIRAVPMVRKAQSKDTCVSDGGTSTGFILLHHISLNCSIFTILTETFKDYVLKKHGSLFPDYGRQTNLIR